MLYHIPTSKSCFKFLLTCSLFSIQATSCQSTSMSIPVQASQEEQVNQLLNEILNSNSSRQIKKVLTNAPEKIAQQCINIIIKNYLNLEWHHIQGVIQFNEKFTTQFIEIALKDSSHLSIPTLIGLSEYDKRIQEICEKRLNQLFPPNTQSGGHIQLRKKQILSNVLSSHNEKFLSKELEKLIIQVGANEELLINEGKYIFYHGVHKNFIFFSDIYTKLWEIINHKHINNFRFLRFYNKNRLIIADRHKKRCDEKILHRNWKFYLMHAILHSNLHDITAQLEENNRVLFTNCALLANIVGTDTIDFSLRYVAQNFSYNLPEISCETLFRIQNMSQFYKKYKTEFDELYALYKKIGQGRLLQIAIPKNLVDKYVYSIDWLWQERKILTCQMRPLPGHGNISKLLEKLIDNPDEIYDDNDWQHAIILTDDIMLNPDSGVEMYVYFTGDPEEIQQYTSKRDKLFARIQNEYDAEYLGLRKTTQTIKQNIKSIRSENYLTKQLAIGTIATVIGASIIILGTKKITSSMTQHKKNLSPKTAIEERQVNQNTLSCIV